MDLLPLAQYLETKNFGVQAKTIFVNQLPAESPNGILLRNKLQGTLINYELPGYYKSRFQLVVRSNSYQTGTAQIASVVTALTVQEALIGTMYFKFMRPLTMPVVFPISKGNLIEFAVDFETAFVIE